MDKNKRAKLKPRLKNGALRAFRRAVSGQIVAARLERDRLLEEKEAEKARADKWERKYWEKLKRQIEYGQKDVVTLSLMVARDPFEEAFARSRIPEEELERHKKQAAARMLADSLCGNWDCVKTSETPVGERIDLRLLKWKDEEAEREYEEMKGRFGP